jgi:hypothetical protein
MRWVCNIKVKSSDIFDDVVILGSNRDDRGVVMMDGFADSGCHEAIPDCE